ncbi:MULTISPECIES: DUF7006 family protein [Enterococcus]|nr:MULTISPECIES: hypothetical protein [Enterococcus]OTP22391.1 hypothetical protein A5800_000203 [Enterococcus sp. 5B7_DIV0075]
MDISKNEEYYLSNFERLLYANGMDRYKKIESYYNQIKFDVLNCLNVSSRSTLWKNILELILLDEKLTLLNECLAYMEVYEISEIELIEMVEKEYKNYNKEICGYSCDQSTPFSLIFPDNFTE